MSEAVKARIYITPRRGILDPQGKAIERSLHALGFDEVEEVRLGKYIEMQMRETDPEQATRRIDDMCRQLLANGVIEDYRFELAA